ncbi:unnamed protein product [Polarella glacialis]|uniref:Uncharacterized protein n=1 Tax=Polarella glacialis TaxID=89957 RepID=A0A813FGL2_POLGL|nr:unnamed protein product [Polarella glacialis]
MAAAFLAHPAVKGGRRQEQTSFLLSKGVQEGELRKAVLLHEQGAPGCWPLKPLAVNFPMPRAPPVQPPGPSRASPSASHELRAAPLSTNARAAKSSRAAVEFEGVVRSASDSDSDSDSNKSSSSSDSSASGSCTARVASNIKMHSGGHSCGQDAAESDPRLLKVSHVRAQAVAAPITSLGFLCFKFLFKFLQSQSWTDSEGSRAKSRWSEWSCRPSWNGFAEAKAKAAEFRRACAGKLVVEALCGELEAEGERLGTAWRKAVAAASASWPQVRSTPKSLPEGVRPQVVHGRRWYSACVRRGDSCEWLLGPLRPTAEAAAEDCISMSSVNEGPAVVKAETLRKRKLQAT